MLEVISLTDREYAFNAGRHRSVLVIGTIHVLLIQSQLYIIPIILCLHLEVGLNEYLAIYKALQLHHYVHIVPGWQFDLLYKKLYNISSAF